MAALGAEGFGEHLADAGVADARLHHFQNRIAAVDAAQVLRDAQEPLVVGADAEAGIKRAHLLDQLTANQHARVGDRHRLAVALPIPGRSEVAQEAAIGGVVTVAGGDQVGSAGRECGDVRQAGGGPEGVIGADEAQVAARRQAQAPVPGVVDALVRLAAQEDPLLGEGLLVALHQLGGAVAGGVIEQQQFPIRVGLLGQAGQELGQLGGAVPGGNQDREGGGWGATAHGASVLERGWGRHGATTNRRGPVPDNLQAP